ncbi:hypothetical protein NB689_003253 [Xanthomonas sacchari]|nr:hypothetical protein [Xanthomonas sacchari]
MGGVELGREAAQAVAQVVHVAQQHAAGGVVAGGADHLREVDHHRTIGGDQHVVFGQVAVHQAQAQHLHHVADQLRVEGARLLWFQFHLAQAWRALPVGIGDQVHQQHAVEVAARLRHVHAGVHQLVQGVGLGVLPRGFLLAAAELAGLADRPRLAAATHLAPFLVLHAGLEAALRHVLVDLGAEHVVAGLDHVDRGLLAALERAQHAVDDAVVDQRLQARGDLHRVRRTWSESPRLWPKAGVVPGVPVRRRPCRQRAGDTYGAACGLCDERLGGAAAPGICLRRPPRCIAAFRYGDGSAGLGVLSAGRCA